MDIQRTIGDDNRGLESMDTRIHKGKGSGKASVVIHCAYNTTLLFRGIVSRGFTWATIVILQKGKGKHQGIRLVKVTQKVCAGVMNIRLKRSVEIHEILHGLRNDRGIGTATL